MEEWKSQTGVTALKNGRQVRSPLPAFLQAAETTRATRFHNQIPDYTPTPLVSLPALSKQLGVGGIYIKDESHRFGLNAFKGLGGVYAMFRVLCTQLHLDPDIASYADLHRLEVREAVANFTFVTATDGNHGKGVAWAAAQFGCKAVVYMPMGSSEARATAIRSFGAEVSITDLNYDDTVALALSQSREHGWHLIQDTSFDGYEEIPQYIIQGYTTMAREVVSELAGLSVRPTHVFLQAGVGAMAGGVLGFLANHYGDDLPLISIVEPETVACIYASAKAGDGDIRSVDGHQHTIMAGLNCGTPCGVTWPVLRDYSSFYFSCPDAISALGMRTLGRPLAEDPAIVSGESGAVPLGLLQTLMQEPDLAPMRKELGLCETSVVLLFSTEGNTDPQVYDTIVNGNPNDILNPK